MNKIPDTGQDFDFTMTYGEDSDFFENIPRYSILNNSITLDSVTTLMWQSRNGGEMTYENAILYCDTLTLGGYSDWRLPTAIESYSLMQFKKGITIDPNFFISDNAEYWWTSQIQIGDNSKVWVTNSGGGVGNHPKNETISAGGNKKFYVRAVRNLNAPKKIERFTSNGKIVFDHFTNLTWMAFTDTNKFNWEEALIYADTVELFGISDWKLPNIKELQSVCDLNYYSPALNSSFFSIPANTDFWSSTSMPNFINKAWILNSKYGITTYDLKSNRKQVLLVNSNLNMLGNTVNLIPNFSIFPNPISHRWFSWRIPENLDNLIIAITDLKGTLIFESEIKGETGTIQIPNDISSGTYNFCVIQKKTKNIIYRKLTSIID